MLLVAKGVGAVNVLRRERHIADAHIFSCPECMTRCRSCC
jgi:hypothetical protein